MRKNKNVVHTFKVKSYKFAKINLLKFFENLKIALKVETAQIHLNRNLNWLSSKG